jgi:REP element-mobilizing transposase RayT
MKDRKNIGLRNYDYSSEGLYFITICTHKFLNLFGKIENELILLNDNGKIVEKLWMDIPDTYKNIKLHSYIIMPNHFHGII